MSMNQEITAQMLAEILNMGRQSGSFTKRLKRDMKLDLHDDPRIIIIKASPLSQDSYEAADAMQLSQDSYEAADAMQLSQDMPLSQESPLMQESYEDDTVPLNELISQQKELIRQQQELIRQQQEQLDIYKRESTMSQSQFNYLPMSISEPKSIYESASTPESIYETISELTTPPQPEPKPHKKKHLKTVRFRLPLYTKNDTHKRKTRRATPGPRTTIDRRTSLGPHIRPHVPTMLKL